jgi:hypothetical protein
MEELNLSPFCSTLKTTGQSNHIAIFKEKNQSISQASQTYQRDDFVSNWQWNTWQKIMNHILDI